jgi:hypothetical protein
LLCRFQLFDNGTDLQADEDERKDVQREHDGVPDRVTRCTIARGNSLRRRARERHCAAYRRENPGQADALGEHPDAERAATNCRMIAVGTCSVVRKMIRPSAGPAAMLPATASRNVGAKTIRCHGADRDTVDQQRRRVVQQAFAFENREDALRWPELAKHRRSRHRVRRSDDSTECNRCWPRDRWNQRMDDDGDRRGRQRDRENDQARDGRPVFSEVP